MFLSQIYGTVLGGFINFAVMISIVSKNRKLLVDGNGNTSWSGVTTQAYNTNAASWALAPYLYKPGAQYEMVPTGLAFGAAAVIIHWAIYKVRNFSPPKSQSAESNLPFLSKVFPRVGGFDLSEINLSQFAMYAGYIPYNLTQTCMIMSGITAGFYVQFYLRNYRPRIFKDYSYLVTGAMDGATLLVLFILSFAVFGAGGNPHPFPTWWGNNRDGNYDWCPVVK
jgi:OPT oligopeptide transporter protein